VTLSRLARMANQIAMSVPDRAVAADQTAVHLRSFWTPAMIDALVTEAVENPSSVSPVVHEALGILRPEAARG
jgi:hypothetical protein